MARKRYGRHGIRPSRRDGIGVEVALAAVLAVVLAVAGWWSMAGLRPAQWGSLAGQDSSASVGPAAGEPLHRVQSVPEPVVEHHGNSPDCPDTDCIAMLVNGDLLFHPNLWKHFAGPDTSATDGTAFDFTELFAPMRRYIEASDIAVCEFETPIAPRGGPYTGYPVFAVPSEVADAAKAVGYHACTHATNHSWDQGAAGIEHLWDTLEGLGIAQTGSYKTEADSTTPLLIESPTGGGTLGLVTGTVSLNGMSADTDWRVDRLRDIGDPNHQADIDRAVAKADAARAAGADVVAIAMHSVQEYIDYADSWQIAEAHALADTGAFDLIYGAGSHSVQPIEQYNGTWIIYGTGNAVTVTAPAPRTVNNEGMTARIQFAGKRGKAGSWRVSRIDWLPTVNMRQGAYRWCPVSADKPDGDCWSAERDAAARQRMASIINANNVDQTIVREWLISEEGR